MYLGWYWRDDFICIVQGFRYKTAEGSRPAVVMLIFFESGNVCSFALKRNGNKSHPSIICRIQLALSETVKHMQDGNLLKMLKEWKFLGGLKLLCYWVPFITVYFVWIKVDRMEKQWLSGTAEQLWDWGGGGGTISDLILGWHKTHIFLLILYNFKNIGGTRAPQPPPPPYSAVPDYH